MTPARVVVAYDIPDDTRRARLYRRLCALLTPVQRSVFEGELKTGGLARLQSVIAHRIEPDEDDVRIWVLCGECRGRALLLGKARPVPDPRAPVVV
jgi:CRISPR-associated endonuclease Cas2